jgi:predicted nucleotidyltransferase
MMAQTKEDLLTLIQAHQDQINAFGVSKLGIFGSFSRGQQGKESDVDKLVEFRPGCKTFDNFIHLALFLEDLFGRPVELVTPESLSPYIGPHILNETEYVYFSTGVSTPHHQWVGLHMVEERLDSSTPTQYRGKK